jgi:hypothetical protein
VPGPTNTRTESTHAKQIIFRCSKDDRKTFPKCEARMRVSGPLSKTSTAPSVPLG